MKIDNLFSGVVIQKSSPVYEYQGGERTEVQKTLDGAPLWAVEVALPYGAYVLPARIKVASQVKPEEGEAVRFSGVEVTTWEGSVYFKASALTSANNDELEGILK